MKNNLQKGFAIPIVIVIVALVIIVVIIGYFTTRTQSSPSSTTQKPVGEKTLPDGTIVKTDGTMVKPDGTMVKPDGTMIKPDGTMVKPEGEMKKENGEMMIRYTGTVLAGKSALLLDYNKADYDSAIASDKLVVLYFYANWCPICLFEVPKLKAAFDELTTDKVVGIRVNYKDSDTDENEKDLARELGVAYQHTKVFLKNGKQILKAPDSWSKDRYLSEINKAIAQ